MDCATLLVFSYSQTFMENIFSHPHLRGLNTTCTFLQVIFFIWKFKMQLSPGSISGSNEDVEKVLEKEEGMFLVPLESLSAVGMWFEFTSHTKYIRRVPGSLRRKMSSTHHYILMLEKRLLRLFKDYYSSKNSVPYDKC